MKKSLIYPAKVAENWPAGYLCRKTYAIEAPAAMPRPVWPRPTAYAAAHEVMTAAVRMDRVAADLDMLARRTVYSVLRALSAKSGLSKDPARRPTWTGKLDSRAPNRPSNGHDNTAAVYAMRRDMTAHGGTLTAAGAGVPAYWSKVDHWTGVLSTAERELYTAEGSIRILSKAMTAATRAEDWETWTNLEPHYTAEESAARAARKTIAAAESALDTLVHGYTVGTGVDLYQTAALYLWERLAVDGLTLDDLVRDTAANGRVSVKTVGQWASIMVRRAIRTEGRIMDQTAAGYTYFAIPADTDTEDRSERIPGEAVRRAPHMYDMDGLGGGDGLTTAETLDRLAMLVERLDLSPSQEVILSYRLKGYSRDDIAARIGVARGTVNKQLLRMADKARTIMGPDVLARYGIK